MRNKYPLLLLAASLTDANQRRLRMVKRDFIAEITAANPSTKADCLARLSVRDLMVRHRHPVQEKTPPARQAKRDLASRATASQEGETQK